MSNINIGNAFPLEKLGSDISRNNYNYQSILNGLIEWNKTPNDTVKIRLTKDSDPWYEDYIIPSKQAAFNANTLTKEVTAITQPECISINSKMNIVLSGGSRIFKTSSFDASNYLSVPSSDITLPTNQYKFKNKDRIKLVPIGSLPTALDADKMYFVVYQLNNVIHISDTIYGDPIQLSDGSGIINLIKLEENPDSDPSDPGDIATIKVAVENSGSTDWTMCYSVYVNEYSGSATYSYGNIVNNSGSLLRVISTCIGTDILNACNSRPLIATWNNDDFYCVNELVSYNGNVYVTLDQIEESFVIPSRDINRFRLFAPQFQSSTYYNAGSIVYYMDKMYLTTEDVNGVLPSSLVSGWQENMILPILSVGTFNKSSLFRWYVNRDASAIYLQNIGDSANSADTHIDFSVNVKIKEPSSIYQKSVGVFHTSNYSSWPNQETPLWGGFVEGTDINIPINKRQKYSAVMMFDHSRMDIAKTVNFINYDGPDLDQGLCIYLPSEVDIGETGLAYPEDGFTFDFFFRIWPNPSYTNDITRDHVVNKAQIYVYSALNRESVINDSCEMPIAKFSMARTTSYYLFGENVSIPDKPVCYRATFMYSASEKRWLTVDYYQLPDHIFVGPVGFIDPQSPANLDINVDTIGNINPNASVIGYETAGFPLFQDPFSESDLKPYRLTTPTDLEKFYNRTL